MTSPQTLAQSRLLLLALAMTATVQAQRQTNPGGFVIESLPPGSIGGKAQFNATFTHVATSGSLAARRQSNGAGLVAYVGADAVLGATVSGQAEVLLPRVELVADTTPLRIPFSASTIQLSLRGIDPAGGAVEITSTVNGAAGASTSAPFGQVVSLTASNLLPGENTVVLRGFNQAGAGGATTQVTVIREDAVQPGDLPSEWYFAEGASHPNLWTYILMANPSSSPMQVSVDLLPESGPPQALTFNVPRFGRQTVAVHDFVFNTGVSAVVRAPAGRGIGAERAVYGIRNGSFAAGHSAIGVTAPQPRWYFAEGAQGGAAGSGVPYRTFVLLANPTTTDNLAEIEFHPEGLSSFVVPFTVPALRRLTVDAAAFPALRGRGFSTVVRSGSEAGLLAERAVWWTLPGDNPETFTEGHASAGAPAPAQVHHFAEGNTEGFDEFLLLLNPGSASTTVSIEYLFENAAPETRTLTVGAGERRTINVRFDAAGLGRAVPHGTVVRSAAPIVAERSMYLHAPLNRPSAAHNSGGSPALANTWLLPEGNTYANFATEVRVLNPNAAPAEVTIAYLLEAADSQPIFRSHVIAPGRMLSVQTQEDEALGSMAFSTLVTSDVPVVAERSTLYRDGTAILATNSMGIAIRPVDAAAPTVVATEGGSSIATPSALAILLPSPTPTPTATPFALPAGPDAE
jgi:hypothetical protein